MKILTYDWHKSKGALFEDFFGCEIPSHYGNYEQEYAALRNNVGLRDVSHFGKVRITGRDRQKFIHSMVSSDVKDLKAGEGVLSVFLDVKGHIQADMKFYAFPDMLLMVLQHYVRDKILQGLDRYIISEDVTMKDVTEEYGMLQLLGSQAESFLQSHNVTALPQKLYSFTSMSFNGTNAHLIRLGVGFAILCAAGDTTALLNQFDLPLVGARAFEIYRIENGLPLMHRDMDESNFPQEARLDAALNFSKGCYLGQEVMARIDAQGHVNKQLMGIAGDVPLKSGESLYKGNREIGKITSATTSPILNKPFAIGYVRREFAKEGETVEIGDDRTTGIVKALPLTRERSHA
jgi:folate-binding protein YgfZ